MSAPTPIATLPEIPRIGLGTYGLTENDGLAALNAAIDTGYRHFDTAQSYGTEANVGMAVSQSGLPRGEFFITTKVASRNLQRLKDSVDDSLETLGTAYIDLVLIHWPAPNDSPPVNAYISKLAQLQDSGKVRHIGVSNFTRRHLDEAVSEIGSHRIACNQVECHLYLQNRVLVQHCLDRGIGITAYMPLAGGLLASDRVLQTIAAEYDADATQVALAYLLAQGYIVIPKSSSPTRQQSNLASLSLSLSESDIDRLSGLERGHRIIAPTWGPTWD